MDEEVENWKQIPMLEAYEASTLGRIRNAKTKHLLSSVKVNRGYEQVRLSMGSRSDFVTRAVHRLVASTFIDNNDNKLTVNHKNKNRFDNRVQNLEFATYKEQNTGKNDKPKTTHYHAQQTDMPDEIWKDIPGVVGYKVSTYGRVKNKIGKILKGCYNMRYAEIQASKTVRLRLHRTVAMVFLDTFTPDCVVNHKDGDTHNNVLSNLECITQAANVMHAYDTGLLDRRIQVRQYDMNGTLIASHQSWTRASKSTNLNESSIRWAANHNPHHGGFIWLKGDMKIEDFVAAVADEKP